jgi:hypothetical protein
MGGRKSFLNNNQPMQAPSRREPDIAPKSVEPPKEPARIKKFRRALVKAIPRFPNDRTALRHMQQKHLPELLVDYLNWASRYVGARPRAVTVEPVVKADPRWSALSPAIEAFLGKVRCGEDLTPHLSIAPHTRGYAPAARSQGATAEDKWSDKDFLLNTLGYHHFHLGTALEKRGRAARTNDLVFAQVTRDELRVIAIFDHAVFDAGSAERMRLWQLHEEIAFRGVPAGTFVVRGSIATSGHKLHVVRYAQHCARLIKELEPKLDDPEFVRGLYKPLEEAPVKPKPEWAFHHLDLAIYDMAKPGLLIVQKGWN